MDDQISYIRAWKKPADNSVAIFKDYGCNFSNADFLSPGNYNNEALSNFHVGDDELSAIDVPAWVTAVLFTEPDY